MPQITKEQINAIRASGSHTYAMEVLCGLPDQAEQEPVAYLYPYLIEAFKTRQMTGHCYSYPATMPDQKAIPLYLHPPA